MICRTEYGEEEDRAVWSYCVNSCKKQLRDVAVDSLYGQARLGQEVGEISALHLLSTCNLLRFGCQALVDVTFSYRHR